MRHLGVDEWVNVVMSALATLVCAVFVVVYHVRAPWWRSEVGRNLVGFAAAVGALCLYTVLGTIWQDDRCALMALRGFRDLVLAAVIGLMVQRTRLLVKAQRESHDRTGV
jgi:hypothetical protein